MRLLAVIRTALSLVGRVFTWKPKWVFAFTFCIDFGVVNFLMLWEGKFGRPRYLTFLVNDTIVIPVMVTMAAILIQSARSQKLDQKWMPRWWQLLILVLSFVASIQMEAGNVAKGVFTVSQEWSPSKMWHTFIFGLMGYWMFAPLGVVIRHHRPKRATLMYFLALIVFAMVATHDTHPVGTQVNWIWQWPVWHSHRA
jgi:hypothetical protein